MDKYYFIILLSVLIYILIVLHTYSENYPFGSYVRTNTMGKLLPRSRDRDTNPAFQLNGQNDRAQQEENDKEVQHIKLDEESGNYMWNPYQNFPNGAYVYNSSYPVYLAKGICPEDKPYYNTIDGQCIYVDIDIVKNSPSGSPDKIFNSDLPGYVYQTTPSVYN
jgi:hypothetical protein